jgi:hypothetical protein
LRLRSKRWCPLSVGPAEKEPSLPFDVRPYFPVTH